MKNQINIKIAAGQTEVNYWKDLWKYRELLYFLAWRDVLVRYKQTLIGVTWALLQPLLIMTIFCVVFGIIAKLPSNDIPYPILVLCGMLPWLFFSSAFSESGQSLITNSNLISKVYFPRILIPTSAIAPYVIDFCITGAFLTILLIYFSTLPNWKIITLPIFFIFTLLLAIGAGLWVAALNVKYRDFRYIVPFILQIGLYVSPVGFSSSMVPPKWRNI